MRAPAQQRKPAKCPGAGRRKSTTCLLRPYFGAPADLRDSPAPGSSDPDPRASSPSGDWQASSIVPDDVRAGVATGAEGDGNWRRRKEHETGTTQVHPALFVRS